ncbi:hypothetical protein Caci_1050 [Catenulispora acidiphila DSM 44928]|uniref:Uncharacterized protein n=1 Tax=Catenulispora acidiphila (strain DSM 44928 / JCM 14897 / NBRC 102108 / NRRL B-24433 / ID139908) TaxID=479433 RepID=C7Q4B6_CATAD|nr:hypothetical protein [Catenulispora acidiphila]ACU69976.1 hypothetical protein Caci_1050 [Catenulispora acidiphila DSM 44928]
MVARTRRIPTLAAVIALAVATTAGAAAGATAAPQPPAAVGLAPAMFNAAAPHINVLPNGDRVVVTGSGRAASTAVLAPDGSSVSSVRYSPDAHHTYVIPDSVLATPSTFVPSEYEIADLSADSAPVAPVAPAVIPHYPLNIVQINGVGMDGAAADGTTFLTNVDDINKWGASPVPIVNGVARVAVPAGHYIANTMFVSWDPATQSSTMYMATQLDITVGGTGTTTLTADERTATARVQATTPRPASPVASTIFYQNTDVNGDFDFLISTDAGADATYVTPTAKPRFGTFTFQLMGWSATGPSGTADPYRYDVMFPAADHVDADQTHRVDPSTLATIHNTFVSDPGNTTHLGMFMTGPSSPVYGSATAGEPMASPGSLTEYVSAVGDLNWARMITTDLPDFTNGPPSTLSMIADDPAYVGHIDTWRTWGRGPLTPQVGQYQGRTTCRACADGGTVDLSLNMFQDSSPDTEGSPMGPADLHLTVYRDGTQVASQDGVYGTELTGQAQQPGTYRLVYDQDFSAFPITQSTVTHTDITVPYTPTPDPKWTLPSGDSCYAQADSTTPCSILPVLNLNYHLAGDIENTVHGPLATLELHVGHQSYNGAGSHAAVNSATVSVSYDKGATWTPAKVVPAGSGTYVALWANTGAKGSTPWLKVTASDALGGSITQTTANAYTIG